MTPDPQSALVALLTRLASAPRGARLPVVVEILPLLADARLPAPVRIAAAARVLSVMPDRTRPVLRVVRALTVGLTPGRALDRLRQLQHQLTTSNTLDALIDAREARIHYACPRCRVRLPRPEMVKHLWHEHRLVLQGGGTRAHADRIAEQKARHSTTQNMEALDAVAELLGARGLRRWLAEEEAEPGSLLTEAGERGAGLCPACFGEVPVVVPPLPPRLALAEGRLSGDGYAVALAGNAWISTLTTTTPHRPRSTVARWPAPRLVATLVAALGVCAGIIAAPTIGWLIVFVGLSAFLYTLVRFLFQARDASEQVIDIAWQQLAPEVAEREDAGRFLTRLCLTSLGRGDPEVRAKLLGVIAERAAGRAGEGDAELQLLAAVSVLRVEDGSGYGRDAVAGVADLAAVGLRGERSTDFAEHVVGAYLTRPRDPGDSARLGVLLIAAAFEAGLVPRDVSELCRVAPQLARVMEVDPPHHLGLLHGLWQTQRARVWQRIGEARSVFDLARRIPRTAARLLARYPDLLVDVRPEPAIEAAIGPVLVCARGVAVTDRLVADPDAPVRISARRRELVYGSHRITLSRGLPDDFPAQLRAWLRFRAEVLLPHIDGYLAPGSVGVTQRVLGPFCRKCRVCGTISAVGGGAVGQVLTERGA